MLKTVRPALIKLEHSTTRVKPALWVHSPTHGTSTNANAASLGRFPPQPTAAIVRRGQIAPRESMLLSRVTVRTIAIAAFVLVGSIPSPKIRRSARPATSHQKETLQ